MGTFIIIASLLFITGGVSSQLVVPSNTVVLQYSDARFNCSVTTPGWTVMTWTVNNRLALSISETTGQIGTPVRFSATNYTTAGLYKWEFLIKGVTAADAGSVGCQVQNGLAVLVTLNVQQNGTVAIIGSDRTATEGNQVTFQCLAAGWLPAAQLNWAVNGIAVNNVPYNTTQQANGTLMNSTSTLQITASLNASIACLASISTLPSPEISTVFLTVQKAVPRDQTVLIATTVAFSLAALLALLIIGIIFCCKRRRRKRQTYQEQVRAQSLAHRRQAAYAERGRVRENFGYVEDNPGAEDRDGVYTISDFRRTNHTNPIQLSDGNSSRYMDGSSYDSYSQDYPGLQKHRHLTLV